MHYRTHRVDFLASEEEFVGLMPHTERIDTPDFSTAGLPDGNWPIAIVPAAP